MSGRRVLVIGSQCKRLNPLSFLPEVAVRFHALMTDPGPGECLGAPVGDPPGLLLDPNVAEAKAAIKAAYDAAACGDETLILAYIGHGEFVHGDFFLMPTDAANPPNPDDAIHLAAIIKYRPAHPEGLIVLLDACYSGTATWNAVEYWVRWLEGQLRFEVLTATNDMSTANAWFTRSLIRLLERGDPAAPDQLRCEDARTWVMKAHPQLIPQLGLQLRRTSGLSAQQQQGPRRRVLEGQPRPHPDPRADKVLPADGRPVRTGRGQPVSPGWGS